MKFGENEEIGRYKSDMEREEGILNEEKVDYIFENKVRDMYNSKMKKVVEVKKIGKKIEGEERKGNFEGVEKVVRKILKIVGKDEEYLGEKDLKKIVIIRSMVEEMEIKVRIVGVEKVREDEGIEC